VDLRDLLPRSLRPNKKAKCTGDSPTGPVTSMVDTEYRMIFSSTALRVFSAGGKENAVIKSTMHEQCARTHASPRPVGKRVQKKAREEECVCPKPSSTVLKGLCGPRTVRLYSAKRGHSHAHFTSFCPLIQSARSRSLLLPFFYDRANLPVHASKLVDVLENGLSTHSESRVKMRIPH